MFHKVTATKQHYRIRMFRLQIQKLFHHGGEHDFFFVHGSLLFFLLSIYCDYRNKDNGFSAENQRNPPIQLSKLVLHTFKKNGVFS